MTQESRELNIELEHVTHLHTDMRGITQINSPSQSVITNPPADLEKAIQHQQAHIVGRPIAGGKLCQCCGYTIVKLISLMSDTDRLGFIGSGYPMYFQFIQSAVILIMIQFITVGQFMLIANYKSMIFLVRPTFEIDQVEDVLAFTATLFMIGFMVFFRHNQNQLNTLCDLSMSTPGDYTILVMNLPLDVTKEDLEMRLKDYFDNVAKVSFIYKSIQPKFVNKLKKMSYKDLEQTYFDVNYFSGNALVAFQLKQQKEDVLKHARYDRLKRFLLLFLHLDLHVDGNCNFYGQEIQIRQAPEPTDMNWKHLNGWIEMSAAKRTIDMLINLTLMICLLLVTCALEFKTGQHSTYLVLCIIALIPFNFYVMPILVKHLNFRIYLSWTEGCKSYSQKLSILMSLLTIMVTYYFEGEVFWLFVCNSFIPPICIVIQPSYYVRKYKIATSNNLTQDEANKLYEYPYHALVRNQSFVTTTLILTHFYGFFMPLGQLLSIIGLGLFYWADKYILLRHSTVKHYPSSALSFGMLKIIQFIPLVYSCQHLIQTNGLIPIIQFIISLIFVIIPIDLIVDFFWTDGPQSEYAEYNDNNFQEEYDRENPAVQMRAVYHFLTKKRKKPVTYVNHQVLACTDPKIKAKQKASLQKQLQKVQHQMKELELRLQGRTGNHVHMQTDRSMQSLDYQQI